MDAEPNTPQMNALEVLTTLVEAYEAQYNKIDALDPIEAIKFRMEQEEESLRFEFGRLDEYLEL